MNAHPLFDEYLSITGPLLSLLPDAFHMTLEKNMKMQQYEEERQCSHELIELFLLNKFDQQYTRKLKIKVQGRMGNTNLNIMQRKAEF